MNEIQTTDLQTSQQKQVTAKRAIDLITDICNAVKVESNNNYITNFSTPQRTTVPFLPIVHRPIAAPIAVPIHSKPIDFGI